MKRKYKQLLIDHFSHNKQMAFIAGPRQVGKTTLCMSFVERPHYFNWDNEDHRGLILKGPNTIADAVGVSTNRTLVFDELHKFPEWKNFLKGFYDTYAQERFNIIVTGSSRLDVYRKGADSLMGRYFMYRMHPLSVGEIVNTDLSESEIGSPQAIPKEKFDVLLKYGGFPEPYLKNNSRFYNRWKSTRLKLLFREDLRENTRLLEIGQVEVLAELLRYQSGQLINFASLARKIRASEESIRRWVSVLESLYFCFQIRPWTKNISRSILKNPKIYLTDWSLVDKMGTKHENFVACHLHKAVNWWQDLGYGTYELYYLRTKDQREVDFLVARNGNPWFIVEVKTSPGKRVSRNLEYFQSRTGASHAFEVVVNKPFETVNCFEYDYPVRVPAATLLSQLI
jgi:predicted AAA+ superfamily ATPase